MSNSKLQFHQPQRKRSYGVFSKTLSRFILLKPGKECRYKIILRNQIIFDFILLYINLLDIMTFDAASFFLLTHGCQILTTVAILLRASLALILHTTSVF